MSSEGAAEQGGGGGGGGGGAVATSASNAKPTTRKFAINDAEANAEHRFKDNYLTTAKYTLYNFIFKNLWEQFQRMANLWFLAISILQQIPGISPTGRWTTLGPLTFVMGVNAIREIFEDVGRHKTDKRTNNLPIDVMRNGQWTTVRWRDIIVGDLVRVRSGEYIPADLVLLVSSEPQSMAYVETANLDGETNLKLRQATEETQALLPDDAALAAFKGTIECELPNKRLYNFDGTMYFADASRAPLPLSPKQVLLRGAMLRNTKWAVGVAVFTGTQSKLAMNSSNPPLKRSNVEKMANYMIFSLFGVELLLSAACALGSTLFQTSASAANAHYLALELDGAGKEAEIWFLSLLTFVILYNNLIPISLYVSLELAKFVQAWAINNDERMYFADNDTRAAARTSNLNEELGQIQYIFSDKTGTLTRNQMTFRQCSVGGEMYGDVAPAYERDAALSSKADPFVDFDDGRLLHALAGADADAARTVRDFLTLLAVSHTVIPETNDAGDVVYQANSPDENALVKAAKHLGFFFCGRDMREVTVQVTGVGERRFEVLNVLEFNSTRKRASVIVRTPEGKIVLMCKGADTVVYERLAPGQAIADVTLKHLEQFAATGLRTLCVAQVELDATAYAKWNETFQAAATDLVDRDGKLDAAAEAIEKNMVLLGATAIEDRLQDGVPEAIATLAQAGVQIWVLTGDKQETAINIAHSCRLFTHSMNMLVLNEETQEGCAATIERMLAAHGNADGTRRDETEVLALVVDGATLLHALEPALELRFLALGKLCKAVVACRVSPAQKAEVVNLVRNNERAISLAIGDGANDVSMIQAAHVGVGISGEEGLQAARASDYAIAQFRFLVPLLLVHGRYAYRRNAKLILYSFYKNIAQQMTQFLFTTYNGWSGQTLYERWTLASFNAVFTLLPIIFLGILDRDVPARMALAYPPLYAIGQRKYHFNLLRFWQWVANALVHALIVFFVPFASLAHTNAAPGGRIFGLYEIGVFVYTALVLTVTGKVMLESASWTWLNHLVIWGSLASWFGFQLVYSLLGASIGVLGWDVTFLFYQVASSPLYWLCAVVLTPIAALSLDLTRKFVKRSYWPQDYHVVQDVVARKQRGDIEGEVELRDFALKAGVGGENVVIGGVGGGAMTESGGDVWRGGAYEEEAGEREALEKRYSVKSPPAASPRSDETASDESGGGGGGGAKPKKKKKKARHKKK